MASQMLSVGWEIENIYQLSMMGSMMEENLLGINRAEQSRKYIALSTTRGALSAGSKCREMLTPAAQAQRALQTSPAPFQSGKPDALTLPCGSFHWHAWGNNQP